MTSYPEPTLQELLALCRRFGLVTGFEPLRDGVRLSCVNQVYEVTPGEAHILMQGLLLGFFYGHLRDDLSQARWSD